MMNDRELRFLYSLAFALAVRLPGATAWKVYNEIRIQVSFNGLFMARHFKLRALGKWVLLGENYGNVWDTRDRRDYRGYKWGSSDESDSDDGYGWW